MNPATTDSPDMHAAQDLIRGHIDAYQACARACQEAKDGPEAFALRALGDTHRDLAIELRIELSIRDEHPESEGSWLALGRQWWADVVGGVSGKLPEKLAENADHATRAVLDQYEALNPATPELAATREEQGERLRRVHEEFLSAAQPTR